MEQQPIPTEVRRKIMEARFIRNVESLTDSQVRLIMSDRLERHPIACVNWAEYDYAPQVNVVYVRNTGNGENMLPYLRYRDPIRNLFQKQIKCLMQVSDSVK